MASEIEHFEQRIAKALHLIQSDNLAELALLIQQLKDSLKVVRGMTGFEKQKDRVEKFEQHVLEYIQSQENEILESASWMVRTPEIR